MNQATNHHPASFRDPSGYVYEKDGTVYRFVSTEYQPHYDLLHSSGLAAELITKKRLLSFTEIEENHTVNSNWYKTLQPKQVPFISYAWEWSFEQLKDAALTTLSICKAALQKGMLLKDAPHSNIQFVEGRAVLIDTLSFETYQEGASWIAYRQFCENFLNPLLLAAYTGLETHQLLLSHPDGVPSQLTAGLLPLKTKFNPVIYLHVHLHAKLSAQQSNTSSTNKSKQVTRKNIEQIIESLFSCISKLKVPAKKTSWNNYYEETILSPAYLSAKKELVSDLLKGIAYQSVIDLGANEGAFSLLCNKEALVVSTDFDSDCIGRLYKQLKAEKTTHILPLVLDLTYPSPAMGWMNQERSAFFQRKQFDIALALALIHHLVIAKNLSFSQVAQLMATTCTHLIIEFVPKTDPKVVGMLASRKDIFDAYTAEQFELAFNAQFQLQSKQSVPGSERTVYYYQKRS